MMGGQLRRLGQELGGRAGVTEVIGEGTREKVPVEVPEGTSRGGGHL